jgi:pyruvate/2-oxoglutarate dehydrogenase complex dihydrolipoamide acyltransferase (E2) component
MSTPVTLPVPGAAEPVTGVVTTWLVADGTAVRQGQPIAEVAIDKADVEVAATADGVLDPILVPAGAAASPGQTLATIRPVEAATPAPSPRPTALNVSTPIPTDDRRTRVEKLPAIRRTIARTMMDSVASTAQLTSVVPVDVTRLMAVRAGVKDQVQALHGVRLSPLAFLARLTCLALARHPVINAAMSADVTTVTFHDYLDLGMAVDTPRGLMVANVRDAHELTVIGLARAIADLATRARASQLGPDDLRGGTFTITNTGSNGTLLGTPILNPPQAAILATYAIERRPVVVADGDGGEGIAIRSMMNLALTYDHRLIDGADAGRFLQDLRWLVEEHDLAGEV